MAGYVPTFDLLQAWLAGLGYDKVYQFPPTNLTYVVPCLVVARFGGADTVITLDTARVSVDVFTADASSASAFAETIRAAIRTQLHGYRYGGAVVGKVETMSAPQLLPWDAPNAYRAGATYQIVTHQYSGVS